ncbi:MAG: ATP-binding protein [Coriobacteriales bacterium]|jgi:predicted AAA+ superfamily ATPase|nr:ATP-binding protein [Coriobacteriales bacterium]
MAYIHRAQERLVQKYSDLFKVVVVTGPRQVGKTTMLMHLIDAECREGARRSYVSLDTTSQRLLAKEDPALFLERYSPPVLIDEIQYVPELFSYIKRATDLSDTMGAYWLTGSQPFRLMKGLSEPLAGRVGIIEMQGLSNSEIAGIKSEPYQPEPDYFLRRARAARKLNLSETYRRIMQGSFPAIASLPSDTLAAGYDALVDTYLMRDIRDLTQVADEQKFRKFIAACAALTSRPVVYSELARIADIDEKTAKSWLSLLISSYLIVLIQPYYNNIIKRIAKRPVMHFLDTGLAAHLAGWESPVALERGALSGQVFESYVFGELYKSFANAGIRPPLHFFRTNDKKEIDLLLEQNGVLSPIGIKKGASPSSADTRHFNALDPVAQDDVPPELLAFKRETGTGCVVCMADDAYPINRSSWALPAWAI